jgi:hypothetical protein
MNMKVQNKARSHDDVLNCWSHWTHRWMEFISDCPDLVQTRWFYESADISETMAVEMRKLVSVWVMLYGSDIVRIILSVVDYDVAKKCRLDLLKEHETDDNMSMAGWLSILHHVRQADLLDLDVEKKPRFDRLIEMMGTVKHPFFDTALSVFRRQWNIPA